MIKTTITAKKHLGQNFLRNKNILEIIVGERELMEEDILEIGPGPGDLTEAILAKNPKSLTVIEIDSDMIPLLKERFGEKIEIYHHDVLKTHINYQASHQSNSIVFKKGYHVYGNIPYYITSPILMHFFYGVEHVPDSLTITMQKEVADRILARDNKHSVLSLACQLKSDIEKVCDIHPHNFTPAPKVWSTCLRFTTKETTSRETIEKTLTIIKKGFSQKRKKLSSNLIQTGYDRERVLRVFSRVGLSENARAEDLSQQDWIQITSLLEI